MKCKASPAQTQRGSGDTVVVKLRMTTAEWVFEALRGQKYLSPPPHLGAEERTEGQSSSNNKRIEPFLVW
jgi:hypothetical protein